MKLSAFQLLLAAGFLSFPFPAYLPYWLFGLGVLVELVLAAKMASVTTLLARQPLMQHAPDANPFEGAVQSGLVAKQQHGADRQDGYCDTACVDGRQAPLLEICVGESRGGGVVGSRGSMAEHEQQMAALELQHYKQSEAAAVPTSKAHAQDAEAADAAEPLTPELAAAATAHATWKQHGDDQQQHHQSDTAAGCSSKGAPPHLSSREITKAIEGCQHLHDLEDLVAQYSSSFTQAHVSLALLHLHRLAASQDKSFRGPRGHADADDDDEAEEQLPHAASMAGLQRRSRQLTTGLHDSFLSGDEELAAAAQRSSQRFDQSTLCPEADRHAMHDQQGGAFIAETSLGGGIAVGKDAATPRASVPLHKLSTGPLFRQSKTLSAVWSRQEAHLHTLQQDAAKMFWFGKPGLLLALFQFVYYVNSFLLALAAFAFWQRLVGNWVYEGVSLLPTILLMVGSALLAIHSALRVLPMFAFIQPIGRHCPEIVLRRAFKEGGLQRDRAASLAAQLGAQLPGDEPPQRSHGSEDGARGEARTERARRTMQRLLELTPAGDAEGSNSDQGSLKRAAVQPAAARAVTSFAAAAAAIAAAPEPAAARSRTAPLPATVVDSAHPEDLAVAPGGDPYGQASRDNINLAGLPHLMGFLEDAANAHLGPGGVHGPADEPRGVVVVRSSSARHRGDTGDLEEDAAARYHQAQQQQQQQQQVSFPSRVHRQLSAPPGLISAWDSDSNTPPLGQWGLGSIGATDLASSAGLRQPPLRRWQEVEGEGEDQESGEGDGDDCIVEPVDPEQARFEAIQQWQALRRRLQQQQLAEQEAAAKEQHDAIIAQLRSSQSAPALNGRATAADRSGELQQRERVPLASLASTLQKSRSSLR